MAGLVDERRDRVRRMGRSTVACLASGSVTSGAASLMSPRPFVVLVAIKVNKADLFAAGKIAFGLLPFPVQEECG